MGGVACEINGAMKHPARTSKAARQFAQRQLRDQRELAREQQERVQRQVIPRRDDGPPPRID